MMPERKKELADKILACQQLLSEVTVELYQDNGIKNESGIDCRTIATKLSMINNNALDRIRKELLK